MSRRQVVVMKDHPRVIARDIREICSKLGLREVTVKGGMPLETLSDVDLELIRRGLNNRLNRRLERRQRRWTSLCNEGTLMPA